MPKELSELSFLHNSSKTREVLDILKHLNCLSFGFIKKFFHRGQSVALLSVFHCMQHILVFPS